MKFTWKLAKWGLVLALVFGAAFLLYAAVKINRPLTDQAEGKMFVVKPGSGAKQIAAELEAQNLVSSSLLFRTYLYLTDREAHLQAGTYDLSAAMPMRDIAAALVSGRVLSNEVRLTVIEGWDLRDITAALEKLEILKANEFYRVAGEPPDRDSLEGYLFPDTYFIAKNASAETVVKKMQDNFNRKVDESLRKEIERQKRSLRDVITLASIVEREVGRNVKRGTRLSEEELARVSEERRIVAGIFLNRLEENMALESDATVAYITGSDSNRATLEETKINSPYNTYRSRGLPPGPIANPSLDSIRAAVNPLETNYFFFVTDEEGVAHFARTLEEHKANRAKYLK